MAFRYLRLESTHLRQGEILKNIYEMHPVVSEEEESSLQKISKFTPVEHPYAIIVSQDCDLEWDYKARNDEADKNKLLTHIIFCPLYSEDEIHESSGLTSQLWKRVRQNQDSRYHHLNTAPIENSDEVVPDLYADFKKIFTLPCDFVYVLTKQESTRYCLVPQPYIFNFTDRLYFFLGRVAVPDIAE